ncbi:hypothetical protein DPEC_G00005440 [Dallia pectoralis]|uniref:Uncharacterized protein n=1 Tax=Dallia pectoralis TaxID=75939 RepID=A0ACC2HLB0_DALPE|nr:hypothetical protein DPEC_G00005440 [Dallia pectoralis]
MHIVLRERRDNQRIENNSEGPISTFSSRPKPFHPPKFHPYCAPSFATPHPTPNLHRHHAEYHHNAQVLTTA